MRKLFAALIAGVAILMIAKTALQPKFVAKAFTKQAYINVGIDAIADLSDGLHIYICGAGSPLPDPKRSGPCIGVIAGDQAFVLDAGTGGARNLGPMGFPLARTNAVFLTHLHSDHIDGLGELLMQLWINSGRDTATPVYGPVGTRQVVEGFNQVYQIDSGYRTAHHGADIAKPSGFGGAAQEIDPAARAVLVDQDGVKITAFLVEHEPVSPAFGYRIDYKDRSVVISGDTAYTPDMADHAKGADVLLHEALNPAMVKTLEDAATANNNSRLAKIFADIVDYHTSPVEAAKTAQAAGAQHLVLYHIVPMLPNDALIPMFLGGAKAEFDGKITVSEDGLIIRLPAGAETINYEMGL